MRRDPPDAPISYHTPSGLTVRRLQPTIGAQIDGADLCKPIPAEVARDIRQALLDHGVIFFRDQPISYADHRALGQVFGEPVCEGSVPGFPELMVVKSDAENANPAGGAWHSDGTFLRIAHAASILHMVKSAPLGGDTLFADAVAAYEGLPADMKARIAPLKARASMDHIRKLKGLDKDKGQGSLYDGLPTWVEHPIVRIHPETGQPVLYVNEGHTMDIAGLDPAQSAELLRTLWDQFRRPEYQLRWAWQDHDIAVWDNRQTQHYAVTNEAGPRHIERLSIIGTPHIGMDDVRAAETATAH